jgi:mRNA-degrading endonuclease toxin of MazEF toxin-antitoxin module
MLVRTLFVSTCFAAAALVSGCADTSSLFGNSANLTTSSVTPASAPKLDPACSALTTQIDSLRKEGIAEKIEKASLKKYKMTTAELVKADQLNKSNADFQTKCTSYKPTVASAAPINAATVKAAPAAIKEASAAVVAAKP